MLLEYVAVVMPVTDACVRLPWSRPNATGDASFDVFDDSVSTRGRHVFRIEHDFRPDLAALLNARVVIVGGEIQTGLTQRQLRVVEIEQVRMIFVDEVLTAQKPFFG